MNQQELDQYVLMTEAIEEIDRSSDPNFVFYRSKRYLRDITKGVEHSTADHGVFALTQLDTTPDMEVKSFRKVTMPKSFLEIRLSKDDFAHDPVITMAARASQMFTWDEANRAASRRGKKIADMCREHTGQKDHGLVIPMVGLGMTRGCASIGLDMAPSEFSPTEIMLMRHVMERGYARLDALLGPFTTDEVGDTLTERELDVLRRIANGMTVAQTASDLRISCRTANEYLDRAKRKTGTTKTPHTVKVALQNGMMNF